MPPNPGPATQIGPIGRDASANATTAAEIPTRDFPSSAPTAALNARTFFGPTRVPPRWPQRTSATPPRYRQSGAPTGLGDGSSATQNVRAEGCGKMANQHQADAPP